MTQPASRMGDSKNNSPYPAPVTQEKSAFRARWPAWAKQLPRFSTFPPPDSNFQLIDHAKLKETLANSDPEAVQKIEADLEFLDHELFGMFKERDYEASRQQNRYRQFQIGYILLAAAATLIGSLQALALNNDPQSVPIFAFTETVIALLTTYLATISGREPPMQIWLINRRRAESLRAEYFRYLMNLPPYDTLEGYERKMRLSERAADINRGNFPEEASNAGRQS